MDFVFPTYAPGACGPFETLAALVRQGARAVEWNVAGDRFADETRPEHIEALCELPLSPSFRGRLWAIFLTGLDSTELRRELHVAASAIEAIGVSRLASVWQAAVFPHLLEASRRAGDESLQAVLTGTHPQGNGLPRLAAWASALDFSQVTHVPDRLVQKWSRPSISDIVTD
jgi:hypothetical protein